MSATYPAVFARDPVLSINICYPSQPSFWIGREAVKLQPTTFEKSIATPDSTTTLNHDWCTISANYPVASQNGRYVPACDVVTSRAEALY